MWLPFGTVIKQASEQPTGSEYQTNYQITAELPWGDVIVSKADMKLLGTEGCYARKQPKKPPLNPRTPKNTDAIALEPGAIDVHKDFVEKRLRGEADTAEDMLRASQLASEASALAQNIVVDVDTATENKDNNKDGGKKKKQKKDGQSSQNDKKKKKHKHNKLSQTSKISKTSKIGKKAKQSKHSKKRKKGKK